VKEIKIIFYTLLGKYKVKCFFRASGTTQVVELMSSKYKALSSKPSTNTKKRKNV
jgi:hypothetical protein